MNNEENEEQREQREWEEEEEAEKNNTSTVNKTAQSKIKSSICLNLNLSIEEKKTQNTIICIHK